MATSRSMKTMVARHVMFTLPLAVLLLWASGCGLVLPFYLDEVETESTYYCSAQIYREIPDSTQEFTEQWQCYVWATRYDAAVTQAAQKLRQYMSEYMAPGLGWNYRNLAAVLSTSKQDAVDCVYPFPPPTYGGPLGAEARWDYPPSTRAYAYVCFTDEDGTVRDAEPTVKFASVDFAERTGLPDRSLGGVYILGKRHVRFSDLYLELDTPFQLGSDVTVTKFYIQSIGTVIAEHDEGIFYTVHAGNAKFFLYGHGEKGGDSGTTSFCFANETTAHKLRLFQGEPYPFFVIALDLGADVLRYDMIVRASLSKPAAELSLLQAHQPFLLLQDKETADRLVDLTPDLAVDHDDDLARFLWFENFESAGERFLGEGQTLDDVPFALGDHEVTVVAYDARGAYNSATMILTVTNAAPVAADDSYDDIYEDTLYVKDAPGVLLNDTDLNGDPLTAVLLSDPANGTVTLNADGSFTYMPNLNYYGPDSFTYVANDGTEDSEAATVNLYVNPVNDQPVANDDAYTMDEDDVLNIAPPAVLGNDEDVEGDALTCILVTDPGNGTLTLNPDGSFTYEPNPNYTGTDSFTYRANDGALDSEPATVIITIEELPEDEEIENIKPDIEGLVDSGVLTAGQGNSLLAKLDAALRRLERGQIHVACNLLRAFVNEVNALVRAGVLTPSQGQPLIDDAENIMAELGC